MPVIRESRDVMTVDNIDCALSHWILVVSRLRARQPAAEILCAGRPDVIRKEAWPFYRKMSGVRLCWELEEPKGPKGRSRARGRGSGRAAADVGGCIRV